MARLLVDLDGTLCTQREDGDYQHAKPYPERIEQLNAKHIAGHEVTVWTGRGSGTGKDWTDVTEQQLERWGVRYDHLSVGEKPVYDLVIDDRAAHPDEFFATDEYGNWEDVA